MNRKIAAVLAAAGIAVAAMVAGCGSSPPTGQSPVSSLTCVFGATGADVEVQVTGPESSCDVWERNLAPDGLSWSPLASLAAAGSNGADGETMALICTLQANGLTMTVMDAGGASYGTSICSSEEQNGWTSG